MDAFAVPLGLQIAEEVPVQHVEIDLCDWEKDEAVDKEQKVPKPAVVKSRPSARHSFDVST